MNRRTTLSLALAVLCALSAVSQTLQFRQLEVSDGLSNSSVMSILKDSDGYLWIGTVSGLNRYDGHSVRTYRHFQGDESSLPNNYVKEIIEVDERHLCIRGSDGYATFDKDKVKFTRGLQAVAKDAPDPNMVFVDDNRRLWIAVDGDGVYRYENGERTGRIPFAEGGLPLGTVTDIICTEGQLLMVYDNGLLAFADAETLECKGRDRTLADMIPRGRHEEFNMFADSDGCIWTFSVLGVWVYDMKTKEWRRDLYAADIGQDFVHAVSEDSDGRIWLAKDHTGIDLLDKATGRITPVVHDADNDRSLAHNTVYTLYRDPDGLMWAGTYKRGVSCYGKNMLKFSRYTLGDITCIEQDGDGRLWLGTNDSGLILWDKHEGVVRTVHSAGGSDLPIVALLKAADGALWAGTFNDGLYELRDGRMKVYRAANSGLMSDNVWSLVEDRRGRIWIGLLDGGLQRLDPRTGRFDSWLADNSQIADNKIYSMDMVSGGKLLMCIPEGIMQMDVETEEMGWLLGNSDRGKRWGNDVNQVMEDNRGLVWLATREGLKVADAKTGKVDNVSLALGMEPECIMGIAEDGDGCIWATSSRRMVRLSVDISPDGKYSFEHHTYDSGDGLFGCDFNMRTVKALTSGEVAAGCFDGLNLFNPETMIHNTRKPRVIFSGLSLFDEDVMVGADYDGNVILDEDINRKRSISLDYRQNFLTVWLATDSHSLPEKTRYKYRLKEVGKEWISLMEGARSISFTNLAHGSYTLQVMAVSSDGVESDTAELKMRLRPPFWLTWWAFLAYVLIVVAAVVYVAHRWLAKEREKLRISRMEQEMRKNEEINEMKFRFFTNVSHELRTPLTLILAPLEGMLHEEKEQRQRTRLELMHRNALRLLTLVNQLLDFRKGEMSTHRLSLSEGDIVGYVKNVCGTFLLMADKKRVRFSFFSGMEEMRMAFDADKVGKIVTNLLSNAFKFTPEGGRVTLMVDLMEGAEDMLEIKVSDTGIGISDEDKGRIFDRFYQSGRRGADEPIGSGIGLNLVRDFVQLHEGTVEVFDNIGTGSVFVVHLPVRHVAESLPASDVSEVEAVTDSETPVAETEGEGRSDFPLLLVVDDNEDFRAYMKMSLELQYRVMTASSGKQALEMMKQTRPDLVISDLMMPEMDGVTLCRTIKQDKHYAGIPVILLTARQAVEAETEGFEGGADDYVTKPFNMIVLVLRIRKLIELSRAHRETTARGTVIDPTPSEIVITSVDEKLIEKAIRYVEDNISRSDLSVEELARELGMSRVHLYKRLLQITGKSPIEFIRVIRLKRAAQLLRESQLHVSEVAYEVGFNQPKYFSRYFKEEFGVLPSVYQEKEGKSRIKN